MTDTKFSFYDSSSSSQADNVMKDKHDNMEVATVGSTVATSYSDECWATSTIPSTDDASITCTIATPTINNTANSYAVSDKLKELSNNRQKVMIGIRDKLTQERDQLLEATGSIVTKVTNKMDLQENEISTKDKHIVSLNDHMNETKAKNVEYSKQLGCLSNTITALVDENKKNIQHMSDLEKDVLAKMSIIEKMDALIIEKHNATNEKATLEQQLMTYKEDNMNLQTTIKGLEEKNTGISHELEEVLSTLQEVVDQNQAIVTTAAKLADDTATSVGQLENDVEEEFQISTKLKRDMEDLKKKFSNEHNEEGANEIDNFLGSLRVVQVWQLSHLQRIGNLVTKNKEQARGLQSL